MIGTTQKERIVHYMRVYDNITALEAMRDLGVYRLASRIHDLRMDGYPIEVETIEVPNRFGQTTRIARYSLG